MNEKQNIKMQFASVRKLLVGVFLMAGFFSLGYYFGIKGYTVQNDGYPKVTINRSLPEAQKDLDFALFWKVWDTMEAKYYDKDKLIESQMVYGAIQGMVSAVGDPYTVFLLPSQNKVIEEDLSGNFSGVGIQIGFKDKQLAVTAPLPESPAEKAGILAGDYIVGIIDKDKKIERGTQGMSLPEAVQLIRGKSNTKVTLVLLRDGKDEPFEVEVVRQTIEVPSVETEFIGEKQDIAHVKVQKFGADTVSEWNQSVISMLQKNKADKIIIDVRNNPGGYMQAAIDIASDFINNGDVVVIEDSGRGTRNEYKSEKLGRLRTAKVVVLTNEGSASASEILAGALRDHDRATLVGEKSFGKGTIQEPLQLEEGAGLHVTIAKWLTPKGTWVHGNGLDPDYAVDQNLDTEEDEQLQKAIEVVSS
jgi:carboxyl-terminal processing protease